MANIPPANVTVTLNMSKDISNNYIYNYMLFSLYFGYSPTREFNPYPTSKYYVTRKKYNRDLLLF